jgi:C-terminal processing protease CtpA/Prc
VIFALWSGEELGLLGSEHWAEHPTVPLNTITANLNLDMVGRAGNGKLQVLGAGTSPEFASWMADAREKSGLDLVVSTSGNSLGGSSDHQTFLKRRIPALHLFSGLHADYHKPSDTADKFEADGAAKVAELGVVLADDMAREKTLAFIEPKIDKERQEQIKGGFRAWFGSVPSYTYDGKGVLLDGTSNGSPAERAGLIKGDVLTQVGDVKIDNIYDMVYALQLYKPGDVVLAKYTRDGAPQEVRVTLSSRELQ